MCVPPLTGLRPFCASETWRIAMLFVNEGFTFRNFLVDVFTVFVFIAWFWLLITVFMDLFRRHDIGMGESNLGHSANHIPAPCRVGVPDHAKPRDGRAKYPTSSA